MGTAVSIGKFAAIPAGMDVEEAYTLIDLYSQECEQLTSIDAITELQFKMMIDFTTRVSLSQIPEGISPEIFSCIQYINRHLNESIGIMDVASFLGKSRAYAIAKFKQELGFNIGEYITHAKIQEAKSLLRYSDKSLSGKL